MVLDAEIKRQLKQYLELLENNIIIKICTGNDSVSKDMLSFVKEFSSMSQKIFIEKEKLTRTPSFSINRENNDTGIVFAGIPLGHEFTSLVLALLQVSGYPPKIEKSLIDQIKKIEGEYNFETYVNLSCHNCSEVVQAINTMSILNSRISHTMIDGETFKDEVKSKDIMAVPSVFLNGAFLASGRMGIEEILMKIGEDFETSDLENKEPFDVLVVGGGPAGITSAVYTARKGIRTGIIAERLGGQILDTMGIENFISIPHIEGSKLSASLIDHLKEYNIDIIKNQRAKDIRKNDLIEIELESGIILKSKTVIISTGARWRNINVPGESEFKNKGVAYCPHCDGPIFEGKDIAVIGGGNSGIEAAIDLAGITKSVTVIEFLPELKADAILQNRLYSLQNVKVIKNVQTKEITGKEKVNGIKYIERSSGEELSIDVHGVFVQIGLIPNTEWLAEKLKRNQIGEILVDAKGATSMEGVFAAGDCTNTPYKQIIISMGSGATAALGSFDYIIRH
ncbi:MAG: alkyl hydroperoxide reductase subunit F [Clostridiales bacterium]